MRLSPAGASAGSSPLARGLRQAAGQATQRPRIIPARAGFTPVAGPPPATPRDHPRSRGVYVAGALLLIGALGSSPLARGLLLPRPEQGTEGGIIPARAGFTGPGSCSAVRSGDHPRSRGVYVEISRRYDHLSGSSPLARGLLKWNFKDTRAGRIIPARAGFTAWGREVAKRVADHPRSRGVYSPRRSRVTEAVGSSPLARGLLHGRPGEDEPGGSSPLARGLLSDSGGVMETFRIIPARAGFTQGHASGSYAPRDHPRSRGVYAAAHASTPILAGSSPLARGLLPFSQANQYNYRIIPARAGFT